ncbi:15061_t:CDS:2 [Gigaspora margarita]|uniref:15061_t:CDS:1 n=1 Tax=Gigaspora margarita TaxID=4874 RepID=A0ABN7UX41_GIGMA|nr:15061_t:CDS:2 [Gigaspora margarita]
MEKQAQASSTTIAEDTTEDILKNTNDSTDRMPVGHLHLEEAQPGLLEAILCLAALEQMNYKISHSATYLKLFPKQFNTEEGKQHVKTVPVKLLRSQNTTRKRHKNTYFCTSLVRNIKEMVLLLGPQSVLTISQDDKARILLSLAIANKQALILIKLEYRV